VKERVGSVLEEAVEWDVDAVCVPVSLYVKRDGGVGSACPFARYLFKELPVVAVYLGNVVRTHASTPVPACEVFVTESGGMMVRPPGDERRTFSVVPFQIQPRYIYDRDDMLAYYVRHFKSQRRYSGHYAFPIRDLVVQSAQALVRLANRRCWSRVVLPRPGCWAGALSWECLADELGDVLDDRFTVLQYVRKNELLYEPLDKGIVRKGDGVFLLEHGDTVCSRARVLHCYDRELNEIEGVDLERQDGWEIISVLLVGKARTKLVKIGASWPVRKRDYIIDFY